MTNPTNTAIKTAIDEYCVKLYQDEKLRSHLGFSIMGEECDRKLYLNFRHAGKEVFSGRMYRLFNVGHSAEPRFVGYLRGIGFIVQEFENPVLHFHPESDSYWLAAEFDVGDGLVEDVSGVAAHEEMAERRGLKRKQFKSTGINGHYAGSCDGILTGTNATIAFGLAVGEKWLVSFKTNGTGAGYTSVQKDGMKRAKPKHFVQECQYGYKMGIKKCLYLIENKNDSDITVEIVELDWRIGEEQERRADRIINGSLPRKIAESSAFMACKFCFANENCFHNKPIDINCRSCVHSKPVENAGWYCGRWSALIPETAIKDACPDWKGVL